MGEMVVLDRDGDSRTTWDPDNAEEVAVAQALFESLRGKGYLAYRVIGDGSRGEQMHTFDAEAGSVVLTPALKGG